MTGYLVMCATNADDLILQRFAGKEQAEEYARMLADSPEALEEVCNSALDKLGRDWSGPQAIYIACLGDEVTYDFLEEGVAS